MTKWIKRITVTVSALVLIVLFGCSAVMDAVTPCYIEPEAIRYADANPTSFMPFTTLWDAHRIDSMMGYKHILNQVEKNRLLEDDDMKYSFLKNVQAVHKQGAQALQETVFSPEGPIGLLFPTLFGGTLGALLIKRPGDVKKNT